MYDCKMGGVTESYSCKIGGCTIGCVNRCMSDRGGGYATMEWYGNRVEVV